MLHRLIDSNTKFLFGWNSDTHQSALGLNADVVWFDDEQSQGMSMHPVGDLSVAEMVNDIVDIGTLYDSESLATVEQLSAIFELDFPYVPSVGCKVFCGLKIITKYLPNAGIEAADHDIVWSVSFDDIVKANITVADSLKLRLLRWHEDDDGLAAFV